MSEFFQEGSKLQNTFLGHAGGKEPRAMDRRVSAFLFRKLEGDWCERVPKTSAVMETRYTSLTVRSRTVKFLYPLLLHFVIFDTRHDLALRAAGFFA